MPTLIKGERQHNDYRLTRSLNELGFIGCNLNPDPFMQYAGRMVHILLRVYFRLFVYRTCCHPGSDGLGAGPLQ